MILPFTKMQGIGNDFIVVDGRTLPLMDWPALAPRLCDRRFGIGSDGILVVEDALGSDAAMRMFNPDGTEDFCGNGLRCVARYVADGRRMTDDGRRATGCTELALATLAGPRRAEVHADGSVTVEMGEPRFAPEEIPIGLGAAAGDGRRVTEDGRRQTTGIGSNPSSVIGDQSTIQNPKSKIQNPQVVLDGETLSLFPLSTGTTHTILFVPELPDDERFFRLSPKIEHHPLFPGRTSVMWTKVEGPGRLRLRIWERGAGETWGCGTGACAAAVAARLRGYTGEETVVASKGGELRIRWDGSGAILKSGPAERVYEGRIAV